MRKQEAQAKKTFLFKVPLPEGPERLTNHVYFLGTHLRRKKTNSISRSRLAPRISWSRYYMLTETHFIGLRKALFTLSSG